MTDQNRILAESADGIPEKAGLGLGTPAESRAKAQERHRRRIAALKTRVPARVASMIDQTPSLYQGRLVKALAGECSTKQAIVAHCQQCVGYEDVKARVGGCTAFGCPLHFHRPHQEKKKPTD
jgi:hypothetical protein